MASYNLYAHVICPAWDMKNPPYPSKPLLSHIQHVVFVGNYPSLNDARWWAINIKRVWLDTPTNMILVTERQIMGFHIETVP